MDKKNKKKSTGNTPQATAHAKQNTAERAHKEAEKDIHMDPDLSGEHHPEDDMDEGELARLEGEE